MFLFFKLPCEGSSQDQWHHNFEIPANFSTRTEEAITTGRLTKRIRTEMIQSLSCLVMIHTKSPSSEQYNLVCRKLIEKYPTLKDDIGSTGYVSVVILVWGLPAYFIQEVGV